MKSLSETVKDGDQKKRQLQEQIDQLNEECAKLSAQGYFVSCYILTLLYYMSCLLRFISDCCILCTAL